MSAPLSAVMSGYLDLRWRLNPVEATYHGVTDFDGMFAAYDAESVREQLAALVSYENAIEEAEAETLADEIDRTAVLHSLRHDLLLLGMERKFAHDPSFHLMHAAYFFGQCLQPSEQELQLVIGQPAAVDVVVDGQFVRIGVRSGLWCRERVLQCRRP